jgi:hypothetical protein
VRREDAPRAGWYPDPELPSRLRWWDGEDWTDIRRPRPTEIELADVPAPDHEAAARSMSAPYSTPGNLTRQDTQQIISEVRDVARSEVDRAVTMFGQRAEAAARSVTPLITDYGARVMRWVKIALGLVTVLFLLWLGFQLFAQASLFDWIGDRIDNLTDRLNNDDEGGIGLLGRSVSSFSR